MYTEKKNRHVLCIHDGINTYADNYIWTNKLN